MRVAIGSSSFGTADPEPLKLLSEGGLHVVRNPRSRRLNEEEIIEHLRGAVGLIAGLEPLNRRVLESASDLEAIARVGIGMENVDCDAARDLGIKVSNTPDEPAGAVAELTVAAALALSRQLVRANEALHQGRWEKVIGAGLSGAAILVVGYGRIGRRVARLLKAFGASIWVADPNVPPEDLAADERSVSLNEALPEVDVITLHASSPTPLLGEKELDRVKQGVIILNAARGHLIEEDAMLAALRRGQIGGAWLDVFCEEPYQGELIRFEQVLLTPHLGTYTRTCRSRMERAAVQNLLRDLGLSRPQMEES